MQEIFLKIYQKIRKTKLEKYCAAANVIFEILSASFEQFGEGRTLFSFLGIGIALVAVVFAIGEIVWMEKKHIPIRFLDLFGLISALVQFFLSMLQLIVSLKFSIFSLLLAGAIMGHKIFWEPRHRHRYAMLCDYHEFGLLPLTEVRQQYKKTILECPFCTMPGQPDHKWLYFQDVADTYTV